MDTDNDTESKPKRKRRTPEEIAADKAAKEERRIEREAKRAEKAAEKERKDRERDERREQRRIKNGPWNEQERVEKAIRWLHNLFPSEDVLRRWDKSNDCSVLGEVGEYCDAEVIGSTGEVYKTSLTDCTCPDSRYNRAQCCKHQITLARHICGDSVPKPEGYRPKQTQSSWIESDEGEAAIKEDRAEVDRMVQEMLNEKSPKGHPKIIYVIIAILVILILGWLILR